MRPWAEYGWFRSSVPSLGIAGLLLFLWNKKKKGFLCCSTHSTHPYGEWSMAMGEVWVSQGGTLAGDTQGLDLRVYRILPTLTPHTPAVSLVLPAAILGGLDTVPEGPAEMLW